MLLRHLSQARPSHVRARVCDGMALLLLILFAIVSAIGLATVPLVHQDEPWIAQPGLTFWNEGHLGSGLLSGFGGSERQYYVLMPLYPILVGLVQRLGGVGLTEARSVSVALATLAVGATYLAGRRLLTPQRAILAALIVAWWPVSLLTPYARTGIPLFDLGRIARYDIGVPAFGMLALAIIAPAWTGVVNERPAARTERRAWAAGLLCGASTLCHAYGGVWMVILASVSLTLRGRSSRPLALIVVGGWLLAMAPWALWILSGWPLAVEQSTPFTYHLGFLSPETLMASVWTEWHRYAPVGRAILSGSVGASTLGAAGLVAVFRLAPGLVRREARSWSLLAALSLHLVLYALFLSAKHFHYLSSLWPVLALLTAEGLGIVWYGRWRLMTRALAAAAVLLATTAGARAMNGLWQEARRTTPYGELCRTLRPRVPPRTRVLALSHYWFCLAGHTADYRSLLVPIYRSDPRWTPGDTTFAEAADAVDADVLIVDPVLGRFLAEASTPSHPFHRLARDITAYSRGRWIHVATLDDPSYGRFEIYERPHRAGSD